MAAATRDLPEAVLRRLVGYLGLHTPAGRAMSWPKTALRAALNGKQKATNNET